jgi:5-methylcytosine-specific restriction endonuclease McrA
VRAVSAKRARLNRERRKLIQRMQRNGPVLCARCNRLADDLHEIRSRARGGSITDPENCLPLCRPCHDYVTTHPLEAQREGFSR